MKARESSSLSSVHRLENFLLPNHSSHHHLKKHHVLSSLGMRLVPDLSSSARHQAISRRQQEKQKSHNDTHTKISSSSTRFLPIELSGETLIETLRSYVHVSVVEESRCHKHYIHLYTLSYPVTLLDGFVWYALTLCMHLVSSVGIILKVITESYIVDWVQTLNWHTADVIDLRRVVRFYEVCMIDECVLYTVLRIQSCKSWQAEVRAVRCNSFSNGHCESIVNQIFTKLWAHVR